MKNRNLILLIIFSIIFSLYNCGTIKEETEITKGVYSGSLDIVNNPFSYDSKMYVSMFNNKRYISFTTGHTKSKIISIYNISEDKSNQTITGKIIWFDSRDLKMINGNITINYKNDTILTGTLLLDDSIKFEFNYNFSNEEKHFLVPYYYNIDIDGNKNDWNKLNSIIHNRKKGISNNADLKEFGIAQTDTSIIMYIDYYKDGTTNQTEDTPSFNNSISLSCSSSEKSIRKYDKFFDFNNTIKNSYKSYDTSEILKDDYDNIDTENAFNNAHKYFVSGNDTIIQEPEIKYSIIISNLEGNKEVIVDYIRNKEHYLLNTAGYEITDNENVFNLIHNEVIEIEIPKSILETEFNVSEINKLYVTVNSSQKSGVRFQLLDTITLNNSSKFEIIFK